MEFLELRAGAKPDFILSILESFDFLSEKLDIVKKNFNREMTEIGYNRIVLLGQEADLPISTVQLVLQNADNNPELANGSDIAHVHGLWVRKDRHRRGLAESMMRHCESVASSKGIKFLTLGVDDYNLPAISLYHKLGYVKFAEVEGRTQQEKLFLMRKVL